MFEETITFDYYHPEPLLVVISGPSGVGKDAVVNAMKQREYPFHFVVTATTRPPRVGEIHGKDYFFISKDEFQRMIEAGELLEHAIVYDDFKGIPKSQVRLALASGKDVIMRVDVQGAARVRSLCPEVVMIFLIPANQDEWYLHLKNRKTETPESLKLRLQTAQKELECLQQFDYIVVNQHDRLEETVDTIISIVKAEHHRVNPRKITL
jgi:guanylate kinase